MSRYSALDLFSGAGGFSFGLHEAGFHTAAAIEFDRFAAETYKFNFPKTALYQDDVASFSDKEIKSKFSGTDIIVAGPPCQGFSVAGPSQYGLIDKRNHLILEAIRFIKILQPEVCVIENVKGILSGRLQNQDMAIHVLENRLSELGYTVSVNLLTASDFGVPQARQRVFIIGTKKSTGIKIPPKLNSKVTVWEALSDLPRITSDDEDSKFMHYDKSAKNPFQNAMRDGSKGIFNHIPMKHTHRVVERFKHIKWGQSLSDVPPEHGQRLRNSTEVDVRNRFKMNNQRLNPYSVSLAVTASFQSNFVHPYLNRNLTAREGARLQSFPDRFIFQGPRTLMSKTLLAREGREHEIGLSQYNQIGNAVPPLLAKAIGREIFKYLKG